jgi:fibronectin type 3 domain-containing protein
MVVINSVAPYFQYNQQRQREKIMSRTEHHIGKLIPVELTGTVEETCKKILQEMGIKHEDYYSSFREQLEDEGYKKYFITDNAIYKVESEAQDPDADIAKAKKNEDGSIDFEVKFYNGGCGFSEALEYAIKGTEK